VLKWVLAGAFNSSTQMTSTAEDHPDNLTISLEQDYTDLTAETTLMNSFRGYLGLERKEKAKHRKQAIDLGDGKAKDRAQDIRCNASNVAKISNLKQHQFQPLLAAIVKPADFWRLVLGRTEVEPLQGSSVTHTIALSTKNVYLCGRYIKFSRYLSQTPWIINGQKLTEGSLQEEIEDRIFSLFYPGRQKQEIETRFHAGGREDIDVRMLQGGRPFVLEFVNPIRPIRDISEEDVLGTAGSSAREAIGKQFREWLAAQKEGQKEFHSWRIVKLMELMVNFENPFVQVVELQETTESFISVELKAAEMEKIKHYLCYIHSSQPVTEEDRLKLEGLKDITLNQLTPLRVLHRRTLMVRDKTIHSLKLHLVSRHSAVLEVWASAGTYIKEFVHGDLERTTPNVGSLLGKEVDILQLDVGSLKEGQWVQGD
jgi:tRNA U54 and U55 pseudouridine synthase Pus10